GEMPYVPRPIELADAIEMGKQRRPFLKQARANVLNQLQQVRAAAGQWLPNITTTGGGEWVSDPINSSWHDISKGWTALVQGSLPIWDSGAIAAVAGVVRLQLFIGGIRSRYWRAKHLHRDVCQLQAARHDDKDLLHGQRRRCHGRSEGNRGRTRFDYDAKDPLQVTTFKLPS